MCCQLCSVLYWAKRSHVSGLSLTDYQKQWSGSSNVVFDMEHFIAYLYFSDPGQVLDLTMLFTSGPYNNDSPPSIQIISEGI